MEQRVSIITLGVADLERSRSFYQDVLGFRPAPQSGGDVTFYQAGGVVLALYPRALLAEDARVAEAGGSGFRGFTLAHNVRERADVDRVLAEVASRGAWILKPAEDAVWGGRSGYFADPDGNPWEVAWAPTLRLDGQGIMRLEAPVRRRTTRKASARKPPARGRRRHGR
jgi:catechol 2,3-dioxygenase-like lactoylglutathione lyase family enzyme